MTDLINGKTPEEIKAGLKHCNETVLTACAGCPYNGECIEHSPEIDAIALIEHLEAKVTKWISVEERKPDAFVSVQAYMTDAGDFPSVREGYRVDDSGLFVFPALHEMHPVSHWKPFDEPPKDGE